MKRTILVEGNVIGLVGDEDGNADWLPIQDCLAIPESELNLYVPLTEIRRGQSGSLHAHLAEKGVRAFTWFDETERLWYCKPNPYIDVEGVVHLDR